MKRRQLLASTGCASLAFVAGCLNDAGADGGLLLAEGATEPPNATVIESSDERIRDVGPIQDGLQQAANATPATAEVEVSEDEFDTVADTLSDLPWYERSEHDTGYMSGIYSRYEDSVYVIVLAPFCTGSWLKEAKSEHGEYGWGGCYDREEWGY